MHGGSRLFYFPNTGDCTDIHVVTTYRAIYLFYALFRR